ncbi:MAG TPA: glycosyltransferase family 4 protein [Fimbriiglobus sp.]|jgi:glycosyltransferase involved in cell wall biosynthesis
MNLLKSLLPFAARRKFRSSVDRWHDRVRGETATTYFDIHNPAELDPVLAACGVEPLRCDPAAVTDPAGAIRYILSLLAANPRLRKRFPTALSAGPDGPFAQWVVGNGKSKFGLPEASLKHFAAAFASLPGEKGKRIFEVRQDLRTVFPFGQTPIGRGEFLQWMLIHGTRDLGFTPEEALWFLFEWDETSDRGLAATYLVRPDWQEKFPHALTPFGWPAFKTFLRREYKLCGRWFDRASLPARYGPWDELMLLGQIKPQAFSSPDEFVQRLDSLPDIPRPTRDWWNRLNQEIRAGVPSQLGVNVLGHFRYPSGLQEAATGLVSALDRVGVRTQCRDLPVMFPSDWTDRERYRGVELFDTTITVAAANTFPDQFFPDAGLRRRPGVFRIAYWYWELEEVPADWVPKLGWADEVWAPTRFVADAFRKVVTVPVVEMLPGVELPRFDPRPKSDFGLREHRYTFLFAFDMHSTAARKNPLGVIAAFRRAFRQGEPVELVIKVSRGASFPDDMAMLNDAAAEVGATVIDRVMPRGEVLALMNATDCFVSLHRSEGLGLGIVESMLMGKPVIATDYSGNRDFMTAANSYPVRAGRVPVTAQTYAYPKGCVWGDPDLDHAAELMRRVFDKQDDSRAVGQRAKLEMAELLSLQSFGQRAVKRLHELNHRSHKTT